MIDFFAPTPQYQPQQQGQIGQAPEMPVIGTEERQGLLSRLYENSIGGLGYLGKVLDKTFGGRAVRGLLGGRAEEALSIIPFSDTLGITSDANVVQGGDLLRQWGVTNAGDNSLAATVGGLGLEMALDPSTYLGIGPLTKAGQAAAKAGTGAKGLLAGIRSGERGLVGFGLPFRAPMEGAIFGSGAPTADVLEAMGSGIGRAAMAPINAAEWAAKPAEALFGVNPVSKAKDAANTLRRWSGALFDVPTRGAWGDEGQDLARGIWSPTFDAYQKPFGELRGELGHATDKLIQKYGPEAADDIRRANVLGLELPVDQAPFIERLNKQHEAKLLELMKPEMEFQAKVAKSVEDDLIRRTPSGPAMRGADDLGQAAVPRVEMPSVDLMGTGDIQRPINLSKPGDLKNAVLDVVENLKPVIGQYDLTKKGASNKFLYSDVFDAIKDRLPPNTTFDDFKRFMHEERGMHGLDVQRVDLVQVIPKDMQERHLLSQQADWRGSTSTIKVLSEDFLARQAAKAEQKAQALKAIQSPIPVEGVQSTGRLTKQARQTLAEQINPLDFDEAFKAREGMWRQVQKVGDDVPFGRTPEVQKQIDQLELEKADKLKRLEIQQTYRSANNPIDMLKKWVTPDELTEVAQKWQDIRNIIDTQPELFRKAGGNFGELDDIINPLPRQKALLEQGKNESFFAFMRRRGQANAQAGDPHQIQRMDAIRNMPGGTDQVNQLIKNADFRKLSEDAQEATLRDLLSGTTNPPKGSPVWDQAKELAGFIRNAPEGYVGRNYFDLDTATILKQYGEIQAKRLATIETVKEGVTRHAIGEAEAAAQGVDGVKVKDLIAQVNMTPVDKAQDVWQSIAGAKGVDFKEIENMVVPAEIAKDMMRMGQAWKAPQALAPVVDAWNVANDWFKTMVTAPFPSFYTRNFISGLFNTWRDGALSVQSGNEMQKMLRGGYMSDEMLARLSKSLPQEFSGKTAQQATDRFMELALGHDVAFGRQGMGLGDMTGGQAGLQSFSFPKTTGDVKSLFQVAKDTAGNLLPSKELEQQGIGKLRQYLDPSAVENVGMNQNANRFVSTGRMVGKTSEDYLRGAHFLEKMAQGYIPEVAAQSVRKYHIDYSDLTEFEKKVMKKFIPWYSFSRKNLPPLLEDLASQPAKVAQTMRAVTGARDRDQFTPQFIAEGAAFPLGESAPGTSRYISSFGLPVEDELMKTLGSALSGNYRRTAQQLLGMGSPYLKAPYEQAFDTQLYSGRRLSDLDASPIASLGGLLPERAAQIATQIASNTPAARIISTGDRLLDSRKGTVPTVANMLTGLRVSDVDVEKSRLAADRTMLMELLRPSKETKVREDIYIPKDQMQSLDPREQLLYQLYLGVQRDMSAHARGTTATR